LAIVDPTAGTTRDRVVERISWEGKDFVLIDTAGLIVDFYGFDEAAIEKKAQDQIAKSISESDVVLLVVDMKSGLVPQDEQIAKLARKYSKRVIVVFNKADDPRRDAVSGEFARLGFDESVCVSAISGRRSWELLDLITRDFRKTEETKNRLKRVAIIGRPNVGKSSLLNAICNKQIAIVSDIPGTTRDSIKVEISAKGKSGGFEIIDTAGLRKRGRIEKTLERYSVMRSIFSILDCDLALLVADSTEGLTRQDAHLAQLALKNQKKLILVINKIDLLKNQTTDEIDNLFRFSFLNKQKSVAVSSKTGQNIDILVGEIVKSLK
jgi:GTP-binding protein